MAMQCIPMIDLINLLAAQHLYGPADVVTGSIFHFE